MEWLNYHHLYYFWTVMREGGITAASSTLHLAPSTISAQLAKLEDNLEIKLTQKVGRNLEPTDAGLLVLRYADEIFSLGREMMDSLKGRPVAGPLSLRVGIVDVVPKLVAQKILAPASHLPDKVRLICHEGKDETLLAELAMHTLDVVLTDTPLRSGLSIKAYNHLLGECGVSFFGTQESVKNLSGDFPFCLNNAPMLFPMASSTLRGMLDQWFDAMEVQPIIAGEFVDSALLKVFGQAGEGVFAAPTVIEHEVMKQYQVQIIGRTNAIKEKFYAISVERIIKHPAVAAISEAAQHELFFDAQNAPADGG
jgi:LysR family transcriptional activator of nhaA